MILPGELRTWVRKAGRKVGTVVRQEAEGCMAPYIRSCVISHQYSRTGVIQQFRCCVLPRQAAGNVEDGSTEINIGQRTSRNLWQPITPNTMTEFQPNSGADRPNESGGNIYWDCFTVRRPGQVTPSDRIQFYENRYSSSLVNSLTRNETCSIPGIQGPVSRKTVWRIYQLGTLTNISVEELEHHRVH